jgi:hypothetical protein
VESETGKNGARDRRRHPRFSDDAAVLCMQGDGPTGFHQARLTEVSADGMRIAGAPAFAPGSQVYAGVFLEDAKEPLVLLGVVQHCEPSERDATLGLEFLSLNEDQRLSLQRLKDYLIRRHGAGATITVQAAPTILRIGEERWW